MTPSAFPNGEKIKNQTIWLHNKKQPFSSCELLAWFGGINLGTGCVKPEKDALGNTNLLVSDNKSFMDVSTSNFWCIFFTSC